jgi:hypothetical protein
MLLGLGAALAAPAIVRAESLMKLYVPRLIVAPPVDWLPCDGRALDRAVYHELFANVGTAYGSGDGSTTFNIPDLRSRLGIPAECAIALEPRIATRRGRLVVPGVMHFFVADDGMRNLSVTG